MTRKIFQCQPCQAEAVRQRLLPVLYVPTPTTPKTVHVRATGRWTSGKCKICNEWFVSRDLRHNGCSAECIAEADRLRRKANRGRSLKDKQRADKYGVEYEPVNRKKVYERDGWVCGICNEAVDPEVDYPDVMSASLDHTIPISKGGPHTYANTTLAHWLCNIEKSDKLEVCDV